MHNSSETHSEGFRRLRVALFWLMMAALAIGAGITLITVFPGGLSTEFWPFPVIFWLIGTAISVVLLRDALLSQNTPMGRVRKFFIALPPIVAVGPSLMFGAEPQENPTFLYFAVVAFYEGIILIGWLLGNVLTWVARGFGGKA